MIARALALFAAALTVPAFGHGPNDPPHQIFAMGNFKLESGQAIRDFSMSYVTHGMLNANKSNAVLMVTAISGNHHRIDYLIGPGRALDPAKYFIIATDAIGNGLTSSPSNSKAQPGMRFPKFNIRDMVNSAQRLVKEKFEAAQYIPDARYVTLKTRIALGHWSGAGATPPENELQNREIAAFLDVVTERGRKIQ